MKTGPLTGPLHCLADNGLPTDILVSDVDWLVPQGEVTLGAEQAGKNLECQMITWSISAM